MKLSTATVTLAIAVVAATNASVDAKKDNVTLRGKNDKNKRRGLLVDKDSLPKDPKAHPPKEPKAPPPPPKDLKEKDGLPPPKGLGPKGEKIMKGVEAEARAANLDLLKRMQHSSVAYSGGRGYACRFDSTGLGGPDDPLADPFSNKYFDRVADQNSLKDCQALCDAEPWCIGVEYGFANKRCELWRAEIGHFAERDSKWGCFRKFQGSDDAVCRVSNADLVLGSYLDDSGEHMEIAKLDSIEQCTQVCANDPTCTGVGFNECAGECELWKSEIGLMLPVRGQKCLTKFSITEPGDEILLKPALKADEINSP